MSYEYDHDEKRKRRDSESHYVGSVDVENGSIPPEVTWHVGSLDGSDAVGPREGHHGVQTLYAWSQDDVSGVSQVLYLSFLPQRRLHTRNRSLRCGVHGVHVLLPYSGIILVCC